MFLCAILCIGLKQKFKPMINSIRLCKEKNLSKVMIQYTCTCTFVVTVCSNYRITELPNAQTCSRTWIKSMLKRDVGISTVFCSFFS